MIQRTHAGVPVGELAPIGFHIIDKLLQSLCRHQRIDHKSEGRDGNIENRLKVLQWIVQRSALEDRLGNVCGRSTEKYGVAVRAGTGDCGSRQRAATAALVLDYNRAKKRFDLLRPWARDSVEL